MPLMRVASGAPPPSTAEQGTTSTGWRVATLSLSMLLSSLGTSIANVGLPTLQSAFGATFQEVQWVVLAYLVAISSLIVGAGRLGDIVGRCRLLLMGLSVFTVASALCAAAPTLGLLIAARAAQGAGGAVMMALTLALVGESVPQARIGRAMGLLGTMSAVGTALGPSLGGVLIAGFGWRAIFLVQVPMGALAVLMARGCLPMRRSGEGETPGFDVLGTVLLAATLAAYSLAMTLGRGRFGTTNAAMAAAAACGLGLFARVQARASTPLIRLETLRERPVLVGLAGSAIVASVMNATLVVGPFHLARGLGLEPAAVGLAMSLGPVLAALSAAPAGRLVDRLGPRRVSLVGLVGAGVGSGLLALLPAVGLAPYLAPMALLTTSYALFQTANNTAVMGAIPAEQRGVISGMLSLSRNLGLVTGASVMGAVFVLGTGAAELASASPEAVARGLRSTFAVAAGMLAVALALHRSASKPT